MVPDLQGSVRDTNSQASLGVLQTHYSYPQALMTPSMALSMPVGSPESRAWHSGSAAFGYIWLHAESEIALASLQFMLWTFIIRTL